jgi:predicted kinase
MKVVVPRFSLVVLCGPAGCGKSTFAQRVFPPTAIVSSDQLRAMIADDEDDQSVSRDAFELFHRLIELRLRRRRLAVADSTALSPEARRELRALARRAGAPVTIFVFDLPASVCLAWDARRTRRVGPAVIHRQWEMLQEALRRIPEEGYDQVVVLGEEDVRTAQVQIV